MIDDSVNVRMGREGKGKPETRMKMMNEGMNCPIFHIHENSLWPFNQFIFVIQLFHQPFESEREKGWNLNDFDASNTQRQKQFRTNQRKNECAYRFKA